MGSLERTAPIQLLTPHGEVTVSLVTGLGRQCVVVEEPTSSSEVLVRVQSSCMFGESIGAIDCDCNSQLKESIRRVKEEGGVVVYLYEEGRGAGLEAKFKAIRLQQDSGLNTAEAFEALGESRDPRDYTFVGEVLNLVLGPARGAVLMTNNPGRRSALVEQGVRVLRTEPLIIRTPTTENYLAGKAEALGHEL